MPILRPSQARLMMKQRPAKLAECLRFARTAAAGPDGSSGMLALWSPAGRWPLGALVAPRHGSATPPVNRQPGKFLFVVDPQRTPGVPETHRQRLYSRTRYSSQGRRLPLLVGNYSMTV